LDAIEKHMKRTMDKDKFHSNTIAFDEKKKKAVQEDSDDDLMEENGFIKNEEEVYRSDEEADEDDKRAAKRKADKRKEPEKKKRRLTPEQLAMGEMMIYSSKTRKELDDWGWNRYTNNDDGLPDWFVEDENKHYKKELPVSKERVDFYKERQKELNVRPIKKVLEAKMRRKRRQVRRMEKAKKKAENIIGNENLEHGEKVREMKKAFKKALTPEKKEVKYQVMTKGKRGRTARPGGRYKVVDKRLKADDRKKKAETRQQNWKAKTPGQKKEALSQNRKKRARAKTQRTTNRRQRRGKPV
jgi:AdoMet-dependent rRNA methyltransferase SPB1